MNMLTWVQLPAAHSQVLVHIGFWAMLAGQEVVQVLETLPPTEFPTAQHTVPDGQSPPFRQASDE